MTLSAATAKRTSFGRWVLLALMVGLLWPLNPPRPDQIMPPAQLLSLRQIWQNFPVERRERLVSEFLKTKASAQLLLGADAAQATARLLRVELYSQSQERPSAYAEPEQSLQAAQEWLRAIHALQQYRAPRTAELPLAPQYVLPHLNDIAQAGRLLRLPAATLAAIVDNEQYGGDKALGLSRGVREVADGLAMGLAETTGSAGTLSRTLGLAQMSWADALKQRERLERFRAWSRANSFPQTEAQARQLLEDNRFNLLFTASRMRGWLGSYFGLRPRDTRVLSQPWIYYLGPAWHNNPRLAQQEQSWPYAFNGFFKGWLYKTVLNDPARGKLLLRAGGATGQPSSPQP